MTVFSIGIFIVTLLSIIVYALTRRVDMRVSIEKRRDIMKEALKGLNPPEKYMQVKLRENAKKLHLEYQNK